MRIGAFAQEAGLTTRQVRYWSMQGLLPESRTLNGYRDFSSAEIPRAHRISDMIAAGLTIAQVRRLAACLDYEQGVCARERKELETKASEIEEHIARLQSTRELIIETLRNAPHIDENRPSTDDDAIAGPAGSSL